MSFHQRNQRKMDANQLFQSKRRRRQGESVFDPILRHFLHFFLIQIGKTRYYMAFYILIFLLIKVNINISREFVKV